VRFRPKQCPSSDSRCFPCKSHTSIFPVCLWPSYRPHNGEVLKLQLPRNERSPPHTQIAWCEHVIKEPILFLGLHRGGLTVNGLGLSFHSASNRADQLVWLSTRLLSLRVGHCLISYCGVTVALILLSVFVDSVLRFQASLGSSNWKNCTCTATSMTRKLQRCGWKCL